ncbi:DUF3046 domain-containing protein [Scrofimicrobium sp. R131]|uniref:DUF3046 domain-containing protein n=1 Tax=Scrofimicrobium appendicitidis TaxID=3079930 RepID=A0AAU7V5W0_9ACTO
MRRSEFWEALELAFGSGPGRSLAADLHLLAVNGTAEEALAAGVAPDRVWVALIEESGADPALRWVHRRPRRKSGVSDGGEPLF